MNPNASAVNAIRAAALIAGASYLYVVLTGLHAPWAIAWKGAGVGLLALYAVMTARSADGWLIAAVMALGALGDVLLDISFMAGAIAFAAGHVVAMGLYRRNQRAHLTGSQKALGIAALIGVPLISWLLTQKPEVAFYALLLGGMAATAWTSRFPRYRTGLGAMMFAASDLLIFARMGPLEGSLLASIGVWVLYFGGQYLIADGVIRTLNMAGDQAGRTDSTADMGSVA